MRHEETETVPAETDPVESAIGVEDASTEASEGGEGEEEASAE